LTCFECKRNIARDKTDIVADRSRMVKYAIYPVYL